MSDASQNLDRAIMTDDGSDSGEFEVRTIEVGT